MVTIIICIFVSVGLIMGNMIAAYLYIYTYIYTQTLQVSTLDNAFFFYLDKYVKGIWRVRSRYFILFFTLTTMCKVFGWSRCIYIYIFILNHHYIYRYIYMYGIYNGNIVGYQILHIYLDPLSTLQNDSLPHEFVI